jgi:DNA polymerase
VTAAERRAALEAIATEIRACTRCPLHAGRTSAVPGEGSPSTEVVFVGEGPGVNENRQGRPFVGRAGDLLVRLLRSVGWEREDVFITNVVKCRPPENRDPEPAEIAACAPFLRRQLAVLDPALVVTLGRFSMAAFVPGARISEVHGTFRPVDPATGALQALVATLYHPAAALRSTAIERQSFEDMAGVPGALVEARRRRAGAAPDVPAPAHDPGTEPPPPASTMPAEAAGPAGVTMPAEPVGPTEPPPARPVADRDRDIDTHQLTLF